jgi:hypothetical protein
MQFSEVRKISEYQVHKLSAFKTSEGYQIYNSSDVTTGEEHQTVGVLGDRKIDKHQIGEIWESKQERNIRWMKDRET